jgi:uridylate kinase
MSGVFVLKIGGSFLLKDDKPDVTSLREMAEVVRDILASSAARKVIVVVGGGVSARNYIGAADALGANKGVQVSPASLTLASVEPVCAI